MQRMTISLFVLLQLVATGWAQNKRDIAVRKDKQDLSTDSSWIYDDFELALENAAKTDRPLMVVFR